MVLGWLTDSERRFFLKRKGASVDSAPSLSLLQAPTTAFSVQVPGGHLGTALSICEMGITNPP